MLAAGRRRYAAALALILSLTLWHGHPLFAYTPAQGPAGPEASAKHETIFVNLDGDGSVLGMKVVNAFIRPVGALVDYGAYTAVVNLTSDARPQVHGERIVFEAVDHEAVFRYQGTLEDRKLPWEFKLSYFLDGHAIAPHHLAGASGRLRMVFSVTPSAGVHRHFAENFMVQISVPLAMHRVNNIEAPEGNIVFAGNVATVSFTVMPASTQEFCLEADVNHFELEGITLLAVTAPVPPKDVVDRIQSGFADLAAGTQELVEGTSSLAQGMADLHAGVGVLFEGTSEMAGGTRALSEGMDEYAAGLSRLHRGMAAAGAGASEIHTALAGIAAAMPQVTGGLAGIEAGMNAVLANGEQLDVLARGLSQHPDAQVRVLAEAMLAQLQGVSRLRDGLAGANQGLAAHAGALQVVAERWGEFNQGLQHSVQGTQELVDGFSGLRQAARRLSEGAASLRDGMEEVQHHTGALPGQVGSLVDGQRELREGVLQAQSELLASMGVRERAGVVSFVSPLRGNALTVQFVMRTAPIAVEELPVAAVPPEPAASAWERLLDLFRQLAGRWFPQGGVSPQPRLMTPIAWLFP